jgi:hypothetical protein
VSRLESGGLTCGVVVPEGCVDRRVSGESGVGWRRSLGVVFLVSVWLVGEYVMLDGKTRMGNTWVGCGEYVSWV